MRIGSRPIADVNHFLLAGAASCAAQNSETIESPCWCGHQLTDTPNRPPPPAPPAPPPPPPPPPLLPGRLQQSTASVGPPLAGTSRGGSCGRLGDWLLWNTLSVVRQVAGVC